MKSPEPTVFPLTPARAGGDLPQHPGQVFHRGALAVLMVACASMSAGTAEAAGYPSNVYVNGQQLTIAEVAALQRQLGTAIAPGYYLVNLHNGCWANLTNGTSGCLGNSGSAVSRYGSGEWNSDGSWSRYDNMNGFGVGGTADGCIYAGDWSNC